MDRLVDDDMHNELPTPYFQISDHTLAVTDVVCGVGHFPSCRVLTSSVDHSVKVQLSHTPCLLTGFHSHLQLWDLYSKSLLTTFYFPQPITCLAWDVTERLFFAASMDGSVHQVNLFRQREDKFGRAAMEAVGGGGISDVIRINDLDPQSAKKRLISVG